MQIREFCTNITKPLLYLLNSKNAKFYYLVIMYIFLKQKQITATLINKIIQKQKMFISKISTHTKLYGFNEFAFLVKMM